MGHVVYALTSNGTDSYAAMAFLSVFTVKHTNPGVRVSVVVDEASADALASAHHPLCRMADDVVPVPAPEGSAGFRSRFLKTSLSAWIEGSYLFVDADTVIRTSLQDAFEIRADVGICTNHSADEAARQTWDADLAVFEQMAWNIPPDVYYNSGVILVNDTEPARRFAGLWHSLWHESTAKTGRYRDQPACNRALAASGADISVLPHCYNAQFRMRPGVVQGARILHYYTGDPDARPTTFEEWIPRVVEGWYPSVKDIDYLVSRRHPWIASRLTQVVKNEITVVKSNVGTASRRVARTFMHRN